MLPAVAEKPVAAFGMWGGQDTWVSTPKRAGVAASAAMSTLVPVARGRNPAALTARHVRGLLGLKPHLYFRGPDAQPDPTDGHSA